MRDCVRKKRGDIIETFKLCSRHFFYPPFCTYALGGQLSTSFQRVCVLIFCSDCETERLFVVLFKMNNCLGQSSCMV